MTTYAIAAGVAALLFVLGVLRDSRRFANAVLLGLTLVFLLQWLLIRVTETENWVAVTVRYVLAAVLLGSVLVLPVFLIANGVLMSRREGFRLANLLSLLAGLAIFAVAAALVLWTRLAGFAVDAVTGSLVLVATYVVFLFVSVLVYSVSYSAVMRRADHDAVVVLGAGLNDDRVPPLLASRLDRGVAVYDGSVRVGRQPVVVVSGGQGPDETLSEAAAMRKYLLDRGVPDERIIMEDRSTTTEENLAYSARVLAEHGWTGRAVGVTNNFHVFRAAVLARKLGLRMHVTGAPTAAYFLPSAFLREFVALLAQNKVTHLVVSGLLVATYLALLTA